MYVYTYLYIYVYIGIYILPQLNSKRKNRYAQGSKKRNVIH